MIYIFPGVKELTWLALIDPQVISKPAAIRKIDIVGPYVC